MRLNNRQEGNVSILEITGSIDINNAEYLQEQIEKNFMGGENHLVMDLTEVDYLDSSGLGQLVAAFKMSVQHGRKVVLAGVNEDVLNEMRLTRLDTLFDFATNVDEAIGNLNS